jgi:hypothetical protein
MQEDDGFGVGIRGVPEVVDVTIRAQATDDDGTGRGGEGVALVAHGGFAVVADADAGLLAPDVGPPRALWSRTDDRAPATAIVA